MTKVACPGSFDPITNGHLDIIERAAGLFDEVVVLVMVNESKKGLFETAERLDLITSAVSGFANVTADSYSGLLVDYCQQNDVNAVVKGVRPGGDFDYEFQMAQMNANLTGIDTLLMPTTPQYSFLASSLIKEIARHGGDVSSMVPKPVLGAFDRVFGHLH